MGVHPGEVTTVANAGVRLRLRRTSSRERLDVAGRERQADRALVVAVGLEHEGEPKASSRSRPCARSAFQGVARHKDDVRLKVDRLSRKAGGRRAIVRRASPGRTAAGPEMSPRWGDMPRRRLPRRFRPPPPRPGRSNPSSVPRHDGGGSGNMVCERRQAAAGSSPRSAVCPSRRGGVACPEWLPGSCHLTP